MNKLLRTIRRCCSRGIASLSIIIASMVLPCSLHAEALYPITGKVFSATDKSTIIGATILIEGTQNGTVTDFEGNFTLQTDLKEGRLEVRFLGYHTMMVPFNTLKTNYDITLNEEAAELNEVVVVGYGTMRKKEVTGAVARVSNEDISKISTSDLGTALQGMIAGVNVQSSSGEPGAVSNIQIRGLSSISGSSSPLYVVDGVPYESDPGLSSNEIESIDVLKDAASAAIYGTRGAGGVILITTKQGKEGQAKISFDAYYGVQKVTSSVDLLDAEGYTLLNQLVARMSDSYNGDNKTYSTLQTYPVNFFNNSSLYDVIINDWAPVQNYALNVSGGRKDLTFNFSANYFSQEGVIINSGFDRYNIRSNVNFKRDKLTVNTSVGLVIQEQQTLGYGLLQQSYKNNPTSSQVDPDVSITTVAGDDTGLSSFSGALSKIKEDNNTRTNTFTGNFFIGYDIIKGLTISSRLGLNYTNTKNVVINPLFEIYDSDGELYTSTTYNSQIYNKAALSTSLTSETMINYSKSFNGHDFKFTGVFSAEQYEYESFYAQIQDLYTNEITSLNAGTADKQVGTGSGQWGQDRTTSLLGMLGRVQYNYKSRYMASASLRRDGSSRFAADNRWGYFPSASAGWNISEEQFWSKYKKTINALKLRVSYGTTGNQNFTDYSYSSEVYNNYDYTFGTGSDENLGLGYTQTAFSNEDVVWETTKQVNVGVDLSLWHSKLNASVDYYKSNKTNMLFPMVVPPSNGSGESSTVILNAGDMTNEGFEVALSHRNSIKKFNYNVNFTVSQNVNTVTEMGGESDMYFFSDGKPVTYTDDLVTAIKPGYEAGAFFVMPTNGVIDTYQELAEYQKLNSSARMGDLIYVDTNGDGVLNDNDRVYGGSGQPECELGLNLSADWKGFDISMNWYASLGNEIINGTKIYTYQEGTNADLIYMWTYTNETSTIPTYRGVSDHDNFRSYADVWVEDGSFLRLKSIIFGYSLPKKIISKIGLGKCRFYVAADNILTITGYDGYDPEVGSNGLSTRGLDFGTYPISMQIRGGCQIQF